MHNKESSTKMVNKLFNDSAQQKKKNFATMKTDLQARLVSKWKQRIINCKTFISSLELWFKIPEIVRRDRADF